MDQQQLMMMLPELKPDELMVIRNVTSGMSENQSRQFMAMYAGNRKDGSLLLVSLVGFLGVAGIQRFLIGQVGMGIVYLLRAGFCGIGTIIDAINANKLAAEHNQAEAMKAANMVKMMTN